MTEAVKVRFGSCADDTAGDSVLLELRLSAAAPAPRPPRPPRPRLGASGSGPPTVASSHFGLVDSHLQLMGFISQALDTHHRRPLLSALLSNQYIAIGREVHSWTASPPREPKGRSSLHAAALVAIGRHENRFRRRHAPRARSSAIWLILAAAPM